MIRKRPPPWSSGVVSRSDAGQWVFILTWLSWLGTLHAMWNVAWEEPTFHCLNVSRVFNVIFRPSDWAVDLWRCLWQKVFQSSIWMYWEIAPLLGQHCVMLDMVCFSFVEMVGMVGMKVSPILRWIQVAYWPLRSWQSKTNVSLILKFQTRSNGHLPTHLELHHEFVNEDVAPFHLIFARFFTKVTRLKNWQRYTSINEGLISKAAHRTCSGSLKSWMENGQLISTSVFHCCCESQNPLHFFSDRPSS